MSNYVRSKFNRVNKPYSKFKAYLEEKNISQAKVAEIIGKTNSTFNQNLNGTAGDFTMAEVRKMCIEFQISSDEFFIKQNVS